RHVIDVHVAQVWSGRRHRLRRAFLLVRRTLIEKINADGDLLHVAHLNVREGEIAEDIAAIASGFDADGLIAAIKGAVADQHVLDATIRFAAHRDAVAVQAGAVFDQHMLHRKTRVTDDRLDGYIVITGIEHAVADDYAIAGSRIESVRVRRV